MKKSNFERLSTLTLIVIMLRIIVTILIIITLIGYVLLNPNLLDIIIKFINDMITFLRNV